MSIKHSDVSIQYGYATVALGQIHYAQAGAPDAPPLILMHAAGRSSSCYRHMLPLLAKDFRAIAIDLPGFGYSARMAENPTIDALAQTLAELMDALALHRPHIFGLHTGNKIAAALAGFMLPPYSSRVVAPTCARIAACTAAMSASVGVNPVPMAQTGS
jgi:surfactin synthase thioesterase subunit